ncbi:MAG: hypothetical protein AAGH57_05305 [Pseudomonadota bacterium]
MSALVDKTILLIAGHQPKAGTTSLFDWLAQHPEIGAGKFKELRFFLDPGYRLDAPARFDGSNLDAYLALFRNPERRVLLEASPDYIGCEAPLQLTRLHSHSKAILLFREPLDRMISAYRSYYSMGRLPRDMTFDADIEKQRYEGVAPDTLSQLCALRPFARLVRRALQSGPTKVSARRSAQESRDASDSNSTPNLMVEASSASRAVLAQMENAE